MERYGSSGGGGYDPDGQMRREGETRAHPQASPPHNAVPPHPHPRTPPRFQTRSLNDDQEGSHGYPPPQPPNYGYGPSPAFPHPPPPPVGYPPASHNQPAALPQFVNVARPVPGIGASPLHNGAMPRPELGPPVPWTTDIFGCLQDCYGCPLVTIAPCVAFGQMAEITDTGYNTCLTASIIYGLALALGIPCLYSYTYRTKMRHKFNLREDPMDDFCLHFWCECCALAQEYREMSYRGIDPSLGYIGQQVAIEQAMAAPVAPRMQK